MPAKQLLELFFQPPMALARLGGSDTPLESFRWREDPSVHGSGKTVIEPSITLEVERDGSVRPYLPSVIHFKDGEHLRPVAPFFELWAYVLRDDQKVHREPLTLKLLGELGVSLESLSFEVTAANLKAARRTGDPSCGFSARLQVRGNNHQRHALLATSPHHPGGEPLVFPDRPIPLGHVQVLRPVNASEMKVDLGIIRLRFTPARGEVYGPPSATSGPAPGTGRIREIVRPANRILNTKSSWLRYDGSYERYDNPEPYNTYDGADVGTGQSWGVVDDTCDVLIEASLVVNGERLQAVGRVFSGPPDYAPDRRPFQSLADDLADRDLVEPQPYEEEVTEAEVADLFQRVFETVSLLNLDAIRVRAISENLSVGQVGPVQGYPLADRGSMTARDKGYADKTADLNSRPSRYGQLPYASIAQSVHGPLADVETLTDFLRTFAERTQRVLRPPYALVRELPESEKETEPEGRRDIRRTRDTVHDMRMPPYMRDSDATALSLTRRQYLQILDLVERLRQPSSAAEGAAIPKTALMARAALFTPAATPVQKHLERFLARRRRPRR